MTSPFKNITDPAVLLAMVQDGVECEWCKGRKDVYCETTTRMVRASCPACSGIGKTPLPNAGLDALCACWCEGREIEWRQQGGVWFMLRDKGMHWESIPRYTTNPAAAMRLQVKYRISTNWNLDGCCAFDARSGRWISGGDKTIEALCHAIIEAALIAALTEAMEGDSE